MPGDGGVAKASLHVEHCGPVAPQTGQIVRRLRLGQARQESSHRQRGYDVAETGRNF